MPESYFCYSESEHLQHQQGTLDNIFSKTLFNLSCQLNGTEENSQGEMILGRSMAGPLPIMKNTQSGPISVCARRTWQGIRQDQKNFVLLWFPCKGKLSIQQNNYNELIGEEDFLLTCSNRPYQIETIADDNSEHESIAVALPQHLANNHLHSVQNISGCKLPLGRGDAQFAKQVCLNLYDSADNISDKTSNMFLEACLEACSKAIQSRYEDQKKSYDIKEIRLKAIFDYINNNLTTPGLTSNRVADACSISSRYLHLLLKENGILFHDYIWKKRLSLAHDWLCNVNQHDLSISSIANSAGFKSVSHFSRTFKSEFGYTPSDLRNKSNMDLLSSLDVAVS